MDFDAVTGGKRMRKMVCFGAGRAPFFEENMFF